MRTAARILLSLPCLALVVSCSAEQRHQVWGGAVGGAVGAAVGAIACNGDPKCIAAGAVSGAFVGWGAVKLAQYHAERTRTAQEEANAYGYNGQGTLVNIRDASVSPPQVAPGDTVNFNMDYAVLAPSGTAALPVQETWLLEKDGRQMTKTPPQQQQREPGGWHTTASLALPKNAEKGTYIVKNQVALNGTQQERIAYFTIQ